MMATISLKNVPEGLRERLRRRAGRNHPSGDQAKAINRWIEFNPDHGPGVVLHAGTDYLRLSRNVRALPVTALFNE